MANKKCANCKRLITNEGYAPPTWWHFHNASIYCDTTMATPEEEVFYGVSD